MYPEGGDVPVGKRAELFQRWIQIEEIVLVPGLGEGDFGTVLQNECDGGVRFDVIFLFGAQLDGQVDVLRCRFLVVEVALQYEPEYNGLC